MIEHFLLFFPRSRYSLFDFSKLPGVLIFRFIWFFSSRCKFTHNGIKFCNGWKSLPPAGQPALSFNSIAFIRPVSNAYQNRSPCHHSKPCTWGNSSKEGTADIPCLNTNCCNLPPFSGKDFILLFRRPASVRSSVTLSVPIECDLIHRHHGVSLPYFCRILLYRKQMFNRGTCWIWLYPLLACIFKRTRKKFWNCSFDRNCHSATMQGTKTKI